jgi:putative transposase
MAPTMPAALVISALTIERFFLNLKMQRGWQRQYANLDEARRDITQYIVSFYNPVRLHSTLS